MKLIIVLMTTCLLQVSAAGFSQKITYTKKAASLEQIFMEIQKQTGYSVVYAEGKVNKQAKLDVNFKNTDLTDVLDVVSKSQGLSYSINEKNIGLKPKESSFLEDVIARFQAVDVRGRVTDTTLQPLPGATVRVKNGKQIAVSNAKGEFYLKNVEEGAVLVLSYLGYVTKELPAMNEMGDVPLSLSFSKLDEVQVMAYGQTSRRISTSGITSISSAELINQPVDNPLYAMMGRVAGLKITPTSGMPGASVKFQLRGQNSLGGFSSEPLVIVDGIPFAPGLEYLPGTDGQNGFSALSMINMNDIASINVLKDADATSIYGSRGANGVILIETKRGKAGDTRVDFDIKQGISNVSKKLKLLNTPQYLEMRREAFKNDNIDFSSAPYDDPNFQNSTAPDLFIWDESRYTDWQKEILGGSARNLSSQVSLNGGNQFLQYRIGGNYFKQGYVFKGKSRLENVSGSMSVSGRSSNEKLKTTLNANYTSSNGLNYGDLTSFAYMAPNAPAIYNADGTLNWEANPITGVSSWPDGNPYASLLKPIEVKRANIMSSIAVSYQLLTSLTLKTTAGMAKINTDVFKSNPIRSQDPALSEINEANSGREISSSYSFTVDPQIVYNSAVASGNMDILVGASIQSQQLSFASIDATGYKSDVFLRQLSAAAELSAINRISDYKYNAIFGRLTYNLKDRYVTNINVRRDGSSRFGPGKQFGNFASIAGAWILSNENFMKKFSPWLSFAKLRASIGSSGNDGIGEYQYLKLYNVDNDQPYQGQPTVYPQSAVNPNYHWENVRKMEVALEAAFMKDKITLSASFYRNRSSNQLYSEPRASTSGAVSVVKNRDAKIENSGLEIFITSNNITGDFSWSTNFNLNLLQRNRLLKLPGNDNTLPATYYYTANDLDPVGKPFSGFVPVYQFDGINPETGLPEFAKRQDTFFPYASLVNVEPKYYGGINNTLSFKQFSFNFFWQFTKQTGLGTSGFFGTSDFPGQLNKNWPIDVLNRWQRTGDLTNTQLYSQGQVEFIFDRSYMLRNSTANYVDASFLRLKNASFNYSCPELWTKFLRLRNLQLYLQGQNLLTITDYKGLDPETQTNGGLPPLRTIVLGIQLGL